MYVKNFPVFHRCKISPDAVQVVQRPLAAPPLAHRARHPPRHGHVRRHHLRQLPGTPQIESRVYVCPRKNLPYFQHYPIFNTNKIQVIDLKICRMLTSASEPHGQSMFTSHCYKTADSDGHRSSKRY